MERGNAGGLYGRYLDVAPWEYDEDEADEDPDDSFDEDEAMQRHFDRKYGE